MIIIPAQLESFRSLKDRSIKITFETSELSPSQMGDIQGAILKAGFLAFNVDVFKDNEKKLIESIEVDYNDTGKTPSQRFRGVLFRNWEKDNEGFKTFSSYYDSQMEVIINHFKKKLD